MSSSLQNLKAVLWSWQSRKTRLRCAVMRHAERADNCWPPHEWATSDDAALYPFDPPITETGRAKVRHIAATEFHCNSEEDGSPGWVVVSSPYQRCVQTAAEVCSELGSGTPLILDHSFGEVFGPEVMGETKPCTVTRPLEDLQKYCVERQVFLRMQPVGRWPKWPEFMSQARARVLRRFLQHLRRSTATRRNLLIVTHADGVAAALTAMPATQGRLIDKVEGSGFFVAETKLRRSVFCRFRRPPVCPIASQEHQSDVWVDVDDVDDERAADTGVPLPGGWQLRISGIKLGPRQGSSLRARLRNVASRTGFSETEVTRLLQCLPPEHLADVPDSAAASKAATATDRTPIVVVASAAAASCVLHQPPPLLLPLLPGAPAGSETSSRRCTLEPILPAGRNSVRSPSPAPSRASVSTQRRSSNTPSEASWLSSEAWALLAPRPSDSSLLGADDTGPELAPDPASGQKIIISKTFEGERPGYGWGEPSRSEHSHDLHGRSSEASAQSTLRGPLNLPLLTGDCRRSSGAKEVPKASPLPPVTSSSLMKRRNLALPTLLPRTGFSNAGGE